MFPASRQRLVSHPHGQGTQRRQLGNNHHRTSHYGGASIMKTVHLEEKRKELIEKRERLLVRLGNTARRRKNISRVGTEIRRTNEFLNSLDRIAEENTVSPNTGPRRYVVSSYLLYESFKKLTVDQDEQFFFITGSEI